MPKHALAPTREKPSADPGVGGSSSMPVALSNEVLLRARIAQLQLEKTKQQRQQQQQQRKSRPKNNNSNSSGSSSSTVASASVLSEAAGGSRGSSGGSGRPARKAPAAPSKHKLASAEDVRGPPGDDATAAEGGGGGSGGLRGGGQPETVEDTMRRFEAQVALAYKNQGSESSPAKDGSSEDAGPEQRQQQQTWPGFSTQGVQALREMYREQVRAARLMNKHCDVLARKTQEIEKSNEVMRGEAMACAQEATRLEQATAKLHALSAELDGRRTAMLETRKVEAAEEAAKREEMNASLNAVVGEISKKIKEQEEERLAQDAENSTLRSDLQALLQSYDDNKSASETALRTHEEEGAKLAERLEGLTSAAQESLEREDRLRKAIEELTTAEGKLRARVGEHATRLQRQEGGLKTYLELIQRLQAEETALLVSTARLSKEKSALLSRAGCCSIAAAAGDGIDGGGGCDVSDGGGEEENAEGKVAGADGGEGVGVKELAGEGAMRALLREKKQVAADMEHEKERLQTRCRELQAERKRITAETESLTARAAEGGERMEEGLGDDGSAEGGAEAHSEGSS